MIIVLNLNKYGLILFLSLKKMISQRYEQIRYGAMLINDLFA